MPPSGSRNDPASNRTFGCNNDSIVKPGARQVLSLPWSPASEARRSASFAVTSRERDFEGRLLLRESRQPRCPEESGVPYRRLFHQRKKIASCTPCKS